MVVTINNSLQHKLFKVQSGMVYAERRFLPVRGSQECMEPPRHCSIFIMLSSCAKFCLTDSHHILLQSQPELHSDLLHNLIYHN